MITSVIEIPRNPLNTTQWASIGVYMNCRTLLPACEISELVNVTYYRAPTNDLYMKGSSNELDPTLMSLK